MTTTYFRQQGEGKDLITTIIESRSIPITLYFN